MSTQNVAYSITALNHNSLEQQFTQSVYFMYSAHCLLPHNYASSSMVKQGSEVIPSENNATNPRHIHVCANFLVMIHTAQTPNAL